MNQLLIGMMCIFAGAMAYMVANHQAKSRLPKIATSMQTPGAVEHVGSSKWANYKLPDVKTVMEDFYAKHPEGEWMKANVEAMERKRRYKDRAAKLARMIASDLRDFRLVSHEFDEANKTMTIAMQIPERAIGRTPSLEFYELNRSICRDLVKRNLLTSDITFDLNVSTPDGARVGSLSFSKSDCFA